MHVCVCWCILEFTRGFSKEILFCYSFLLTGFKKCGSASNVLGGSANTRHISLNHLI